MSFKYTFWLILFALVLSQGANSQQLVERTEKVWLGDLENPKYKAPIMRDYPGRQSLYLYKPSVVPVAIEEEMGQKFAVWNTFEIKDTLLVKSYYLVEQSANNLDPRLEGFYFFEPDHYLKSSKRINHKNKAVQELARKLKERSSKEATLQKIIDYVAVEVELDSTGREKKISKVLKDGRGTQIDRLHAVIGLARANKIPARLVDGQVLVEEQTAYHKWIEVFIKDQGWVPLDPACAMGLNMFCRQGNDPLYMYYNIEFFGPSKGAKDDGSMMSKTLAKFVYFGEYPNDKDGSRSINSIKIERADGRRLSRSRERELVKQIKRDPKYMHRNRNNRRGTAVTRTIQWKNVSQELADTVGELYFENKYEEGRKVLDSLSLLTPNFYDYLYWNSLYKVAEGKTSEAIQSIQFMMPRGKGASKRAKSFYAFAVYEAAIGDIEKAIKFLSGIEEGMVLSKSVIKADPGFKHIIEEPIFREYLASLPE